LVGPACDIGGGPKCVEAIGVVKGGPSCEKTIQAMGIIDGTLTDYMFSDVKTYVHLTWIPADSFVGPDGQHLVGHAAPVLRVNEDGITICDLTVATRFQDKVHKTSVAHEMLHCAEPLSTNELDGDPDHSQPEWRVCDESAPLPKCGVLPEANRRLESLDI
jgi:hypothetical protein